jgi:putative sigma-54 modulation protein
MNRKAKALEFMDAGYNVQVTGRHVKITDSMKDYAIDKISKIERFMNRIIDVTVIMDIQKLEHSVEIILRAGNLKITSQASTTDMYVSIDKAVHKLEAQVLRYKSKIQDYHAKSHAIHDMTVNVINRPQETEEDFDLDGEESADNRSARLLRPHPIVKQETLPLKTLTHGEAVMKMELSGDLFLIFKDEVDQKLKVIYRRKDENYGIIEPGC